MIVQLDRRPGVRFVSEVCELRGYEREADQYRLEPVQAAREFPEDRAVGQEAVYHW